MKKISLALVIIILFNFIFGHSVYASSVNNATGNESNGLTFNESALYKAEQEGVVEIEGYTKEISMTPSSLGSILAIMMSPGVMLGTTCATVLSNLAETCGFYHTDSDYSADKDGLMKVSSIIFGEFLMFNPSVTRTAASLNPSMPSNNMTELFDDFKKMVVNVFEFLRYVAMAIFLILLIVAGIRLAGAVTAQDRAKFKAIIADWLIGLMFVFFAKYFVFVLDAVFNSIMDALWEVRLSMENNGNVSFEFAIYDGLITVLKEVGGLRYFAYGILYLALIVVIVKFFISYIFRLFKVYFLIVLAPVVGVLFSLKRAGLKGSNPITSWLGSYTLLLFIQPIHAVLYLVFMFTAGEIATRAPFLGIALLWAIDRAEKVIKAILRINGKISIGND